MSCEGKRRKQQFEIACASRGFHVYREYDAGVRSGTAS